MVAHIEKLELELQTKAETVLQCTRIVLSLFNKLDTCSDSGKRSQEDIAQMVQYISELEQKRKTMEMKMLDLEGNVKVLSLEKISLECKTRTLEEDVEERTQQANKWYHLLINAL